MSRPLSIFIQCVVVLNSLLSISFPLHARAPYTVEPEAPKLILEYPQYRSAKHTVNQVELAVTNRGVLGEAGLPIRDQFTNEVIWEGCEYPRGSKRILLDGISLWVAARTNRGFRLSSGANPLASSFSTTFAPPDPPGQILRRSTLELLGGPDPGAVSEEDLVCEYVDTLGLVYTWDGTQQVVRNYEDLGIQVHQESYSWSHLYAEDFVLVDIRIRNIGDRLLRDTYVGLNIWPDASMASRYNPCWRTGDEVCGYRRALPSDFGCDYEDTLDLVWHADNDGDPYDGEFIKKWRLIPTPPQGFCVGVSTRDVMAVRPLKQPGRNLEMNYHWWGFKSWGDPPDWHSALIGPSSHRGIPTYTEYFYLYSRSPEALHQLMASREIDYPSYWTGIMADWPIGEWLPLPMNGAIAVAQGSWLEELVSFGPLTLMPGGEIPLSFALVGGSSFHTNPGNLRFLPYYPEWYERALDFSDLALNARMAGWVYDNPGVDTDGDGYAGEFRICIRDSALVDGEWIPAYPDTQWYSGDGIADFRGAQPPTAPEFSLTSGPNSITVQFNGQIAETERDIFFQRNDFEGYRVYFGRDERPASLALIASIDRENYDKFVRNAKTPDSVSWEIQDAPLTARELRCLYGFGNDPCADSAFDPLHFTQYMPYRHPHFPNDSIFFFTQHGYNASQPGVTSSIRRRFPDAIDPRTIPEDSLTEDMYTDDGHLKFFEYQYTIGDLLPSVPYYVSVTAYDFGSPKAGINPTENDKSGLAKSAFPLHKRETDEVNEGKIYVYPNPYRTDGGYRDLGYEGRAQEDRWDERVRSIWFANLPPKCSISIYTIDGDRVRTMHHDADPNDPRHRRHRWSLINRNQQMVESGLYYWVVEIPGEATQMGKLVIIR